MKGIFYLFFIIGVLSLLGCNDALVLDTDILADDEANVQFKDDFTIHATTLVEDSILVYTPDTEYSNYPCGILSDPIFGQVTSSIYAQLRLISPQIYPDFPFPGFDSVVLSLAYSNLGSYGNTNELHELEVLRMSEAISRDSSYTSDRSFETESIALGSATFQPKPSDSVNIKIYRDGFEADSLYLRAPHERIKLNFAFGEELYELEDTVYTSSDLFLEKLKGLQVIPKIPTSGMLGFDLRSPESRLTLYYQLGGIPKEFNFYFTEFSVKMLQFEHDYTNAPIEEFIDNETMGDSLVFTQGMAGPFIRLDFPDAVDLQNVIVNKAELEVYIADLDEQGADFVPIEQLIVLEQVDSSRVLVEDAVLAITQSSLDEFGGTVRDGVSGVQKYTLNISSHFQRMINGTAGNTLFIQAFPKPSEFGRVVLYGANHSTYPIRLKLTYTQI